MKKNDYDVITGSVSGSGCRRTRSQVAPDWSVAESLILVNEVAAVEADCSVAVSSYQRWNIIADNCNALDVHHRNLAQCRRKWRALLAEYEAAVRGKQPRSFHRELFEAIDCVVKARLERGMVDVESDKEDEGNEEDRDATVEIGFKRKRSRLRHRGQKPKKYLEQRPEDSYEEELEDDDSEEELLKDFLESRPKLKCTAERPTKHLVMPPKILGKVELLHENHNIERPEPITGLEKMTVRGAENEETLTVKLQELAVEIEAIATESAADYNGDGSQNVEDSHIDFTRHQGDKLIASLGIFFNTLKHLCDLLQECN